MAVNMENEERITHRLYNAIGFVRTMKIFADKKEDKQVEIDSGNLSIILKLLEDCKDKLS